MTETKTDVGVTDGMVEAACRAHTPQFDNMDQYIQKYAREQMRAALKAALSQNAGVVEPVAWGRVVAGKAVTVSLTRTPANYEPLYAHPAVPAEREMVEGLIEALEWIAYESIYELRDLAYIDAKATIIEHLRDRAKAVLRRARSGKEK